ncbi:hypothetical protein SAMN04489844_0346 [Nocardioides exalbidus]|uniref:Uncharacterized protein n=1 Tax=Nocardioides exalbidus TaxID=402596 RepID=A0A1H4JY87_9ACTN|nr:hypothetical protein [Nocardioides exalbidus]SEB50986.1 hypothetical protein SAMN04489844_0346 [Nocardioides exalbidus]
MRRHVSITSTIGLVAALAAAVTAAPATAADDDPRVAPRSFEMRAPASSSYRTGEATRLVSATATFTPAKRVPGMPTSTAPQHQFVMPGGSLSVTVSYGYDWRTDALTYHYSLDTEMGAPDPTGKTRTLLGFGTIQGNSCQVEEATSAWLYSNIPDVLLYDDKDTPDLASAAAWNCSVLLVDNGSTSSTPYDAFVSALDVVTATPQLSVRTPKRDRLVKKVWTRIPVTVANAAPEGVDARDVVVTGSGKGVKVRPFEVGALEGEDDTEGYVWARLTRPKATLRLVVSEKGEVLGRSTVKLRTRPAPRPPRAGSWSAAGVDFTVRGGKVRGFRITTQTRCGGYPDIPTTTTNSYSFVTTAIPRNNELVGTERKDAGDASYSAYLEIEFVSPTKAKGSFSYYGPARCVAVDGFTARLSR